MNAGNKPPDQGVDGERAPGLLLSDLEPVTRSSGTSVHGGHAPRTGNRQLGRAVPLSALSAFTAPTPTPTTTCAVASSRWEPVSSTRPWSRTATRSSGAVVGSRWATRTGVLSRQCARSASVTWSVSSGTRVRAGRFRACRRPGSRSPSWPPRARAP
ncbi:hypothetical protein DKG34_20700 [Streptomyces sp. NWU49]|nr:hypothetical protein DKG34_20700 [Streptomyces sp. NWU49]